MSLNVTFYGNCPISFTAVKYALSRSDSQLDDDETTLDQSHDGAIVDEVPSVGVASSSYTKPSKKFTFTFKKFSDKTADETATASTGEKPESSKPTVHCVEVTTDTLHLLPETSTPKKESQQLGEREQLAAISNPAVAAAQITDTYEISPIFKSYRSSQARKMAVKMKSFSDGDDELCCNTLCCSCNE